MLTGEEYYSGSSHDDILLLAEVVEHFLEGGLHGTFSSG